MGDKEEDKKKDDKERRIEKEDVEGVLFVFHGATLNERREERTLVLKKCSFRCCKHMSSCIINNN